MAEEEKDTKVEGSKVYLFLRNYIPRPSSYPFLGPKYPPLGTIYPGYKEGGKGELCGQCLPGGACLEASDWPGRAPGDLPRGVNIYA